ncbi:DUF2274 domain-containing protein [Novacetimonas maltaceti]|uniref:DUF2274 domain-containing protein n=3 Tax=Acetobacteraceae TaxID=433 RepID=A0A2S3VYU6_9PROT|nr:MULTISPECIES: DUF2274 domain-containing protein [Acetobacteraceae]POF61768.1 hypothetical protein KMAL_26160 [Novacetimonas maltaceti]PYD58988.1 DUF2274 domain-containing protein [Novacetimonas maltaceti]BAK84667.1 hypothetical protein GLX_22550 [Komagataeibacter medellinensis NBRC 3288]GAN97074.1 hypothetical protein Geu3261_0140_016 [Komagataeibacter europaeus NBRC 3261]
MDKLRITAIPDNRPVRMTIAFPAEIHRDLLLYARFLSEENGGDANLGKNPARLVPIMVARFIERDRVFLKKRKEQSEKQ